MLTDATRHEYERLVLMGRETFGPPSPRQMLIARTIRPEAWSDDAREHVDWSVRHGRTSWSDNFGAQFLILRRLALMQAAEILRRLDRQTAGLPDLPVLDACGLSRRLGEQAQKLRMTNHPRYVGGEAARAVFFLRKLDGIPAPKASMGDDGSVALVWSEQDRSATISIEAKGTVTLSLSGDDTVVAIDTVTWNDRPWRLVTAATDWVHYDGQRPRTHDEPITCPKAG